MNESKFFGFGVCQKLNIKLIDTKRMIESNTDQFYKVYLGSEGEEYISSFPNFYTTEANRDENTNELSITAYDAIYGAASHTAAELGLAAPYTILDVVERCSAFLGVNSIEFIGVTEEVNPFNTEYPEGANLEGTETVREVLNAIAEATQTIYYIDANNNLIFKRLDISGDAVLTIGKADYITLDSKTNRRLSAVCSATELGDNVIASSGITGTTQYVRDNPFWELREDIATLLENALGVVNGLTINQFNCSWRGNYLLELGDKIALTTKDDNTVIAYLLNDSITYDGSLNQTTSWSYTDNEGESVDNPSTIGEALKYTYAKVDKVNKEIEIVAGETASIKLDTNNIQASITNLDNNISGLTKEVNTKVSAEDVNISIQKSLEQGVDKVTTSTGFTFNEEGLTVTKSNSEMSTQITEDGMTVSKDNKEVLTANNQGVKAIDLHATTYLIIGDNSRFEDYGSNRTGCFWIAN